MNNNGFVKELVCRIRSHEMVQVYEQLKSDIWTKSCYELLSVIISEKLSKQLTNSAIYKMGCTLSYKTLKRIFDGNYCINSPIDPRTMNTLDKLSKFIDYEDWSAFVKSNFDKCTLSYNRKSPEDTVSNHIRLAVSEAFRSIRKLSLTESVQLKSYFMEKSSAYNKFAEIIYHNKHSGLCINNKYNPSNCEVLDIKIDTLSTKHASVNTKEYWLLCWWDQNSQKYHSRVKKVYENNYILMLGQNEDWKITNIISKDDLFETF